MKTSFSQRLYRLRYSAFLCAVAFAVMAGASSCKSSGAYWGMEQRCPVGNGSVYYGVYGGDVPHCSGPGYSKKQYKKYRKEQEKLRKKQEKYRKKQMKEARKRRSKHHRHHGDD